jgi:hypothetical protein
MGSKNSRPPPAPDPYATASAQTQSNLGTAIAQSYLNNTNQYGPRGSLTYQQTGTQTIRTPNGQGGYDTVDLPTWSQYETLSPGQQALQNQQEQLGQGLNNLAIGQVGRLTDVLGRPVDTSGIPQIQSSFGNAGPIQSNVDLQRSVDLQNAPTSFGGTAGTIQYDLPGMNDFASFGREAQDAIMARLRPELDRSRASLDSRLANQGIELGSEAYRTAQTQEQQRGNDAQTQAVLAGFQRESDLWNRGLSAGTFNNQAQAQDFQEQQARGQFAQAGVGQNNQAALNAGNFYNTAALGAASFANAAQNQQFNQNLTGAQFNNQAAQQALQQMLTLRNQPINEISALMSGGQVSLPQFQGYNPAQVQGTPIGQYIYNTAGIENQNYWQDRQLAQQQQSALLGGLFGLGSAGLFGLGSGGLRLPGMAAGGRNPFNSTGSLY